MTAHFAATALLRTETPKRGGPLELTVTNSAGQPMALSVTAEVACSLAEVLRAFADTAAPSAAQPTKLPRSFAVGAGKYESLVLLRFEQDTPYALPAEEAQDLAHALLEQSQAVALRPAVMVQ